MNQNKNSFNPFIFILVMVISGIGFYQGMAFYKKYVYEARVLRQMVQRLQADSRVAEVLVSDVQFNPITEKHMTTIKFLEYNSQGEPMLPKYFTFQGNIIQFQSLVVRFDDVHITTANPLRGKSAYLFWKVFVLDGANTQEYEISRAHKIPDGYKIEGPATLLEQQIWQEFWNLALDPKAAKKLGIKNAQIEAPGTKFIAGNLYTIKIEHDGGLRIDVAQLPEVLKGERIP